MGKHRSRVYSARIKNLNPLQYRSILPLSAGWRNQLNGLGVERKRGQSQMIYGVPHTRILSGWCNEPSYQGIMRRRRVLKRLGIHAS